MKTDYPISQTYRTVKLEIYHEPKSGCWFYHFPVEWVWYRSNQGYRTIGEAFHAGQGHVDNVLKDIIPQGWEEV